ncbi:MAG: cell wall-binding repeat-containing protein, partial [Gracilibacteraceae bacterium]|nr:cell wall-binding repeat-containing protein [Gracilibacteraceae bacterium]
LSETVIEALKTALPGLTVETLRGANRFETAALINAKVQNPQGTFIVGYNAIADAVSVASYAAAHGYLIQIAQPDGTLATDHYPLPTDHQPDGTLATDHYPLPTDHYILGGPTLVKDIPGFTRIYGADRYATNKAIRETLSFEYEYVYTADGNTLVDALTGAALAAQTRSPIILLPAGDPTGADFTGVTEQSKLYAFGNG